MRNIIAASGFASIALGISIGAHAQDEFMKECLATGSQRMCECMAANVPLDKRAAAIDGMRRSNAITAPGGNLVDPSKMSPEQMQGLDIIVAAQAACM
jgi:hypothetical protein